MIRTWGFKNNENVIPRYIIESVIRHYEALAKAYQYDGNSKAANAARLSGKEIQKIKKFLNHHKDYDILHDTGTTSSEKNEKN